MKKTYLYLLLGLILVSCGEGDEAEEAVMLDENTAPTVPNQVFPLDNTLCTDNNVVFQWNASTDAEENVITYTIEISEDVNFGSLSFTETSFTESSLIALNRGKAYYWRIKATDSRNSESAYSPVVQFLTEGDGISNHVPFAPTLTAPTLNSEIDGTNTNLSWSASDADGDPLTFDVYLDTDENASTKVSENQTATTYNATGLSASTKYYFKVVVKDDKGASSIGQVWSFTTK